ncbi:hypothetical protein ZYGR_0H00220 [Zygosaccharomyces rouxii]|uniref:ZYRO0B04532p n=2 Tax=Zygosaccharomyces rouxii TaxID=4956 RepID=C5DR04_ZYGRC|nr:uncharacterized protein ZYRO0B04532g [Zygosaccharomyces rouxii]KAH9200236.1 hypothetical protein LQ764DRAFT_114020 [Zygosaccharomyces rouxii]GAV47183.1 hypothetical protein ZYGR_0H00220 [Zygosaccharomyces rouxii]CAR26215.1 ZYRO0B04532p [Zygosaccharomyces rouxii]
MIKNCIALNLKFAQPSKYTFNELSCYRYIVSELNRLGKVLYARPYLFNTQSLSRDNRRLDIVVNGQRQLLSQFFYGLKGIQMDQDSLARSSSMVPLDQPIKDEEDHEGLVQLHEAWKTQLDIYERQKRYELHALPDFVKVEPWVLDTKIPNEADYEGNTHQLKSTNEILTLKSQIYPDFEAMPFEMQKWFIGLGLRSESDQLCQDRLDILTHGFKGFV